VDAIRRGVGAYVAGDWEAWFQEFAPEIEWEETSGLGPGAATYRGIHEVRKAVTSWLAMSGVGGMGLAIRPGDEGGRGRCWRICTSGDAGAAAGWRASATSGSS
jgi:hypothetical protein